MSSGKFASKDAWVSAESGSKYRASLGPKSSSKCALMARNRHDEGPEEYYDECDDDYRCSRDVICDSAQFTDI